MLRKCYTQYASKFGKLTNGHRTRKGQFSFQSQKRQCQRILKLYKRDLHDVDNHDGVITHLEPDILECEVKWALGSITTNKSSGGDGIPVELFQTLKDDAVKVLHSICQQIWKTQQWPQDWKRSVFIPIPKNWAMPKNAQIPHNCTHLTC